ncbi:MAG: MFS transporter [Desulfobacterales bacterium]|nr:MFS transporter [Desulfobacterales bacterium]
MADFKTDRMYRYLILLTLCSIGGLQCWRTLFDNFAVTVANLDGQHMGTIHSVREIPGFLALLVTYVILVIREHKLAALSIFIMGAGILLTGFMPSFGGLVFTTLIMSFGFHYYETCNQSLTLQYFDTRTSPLVFGAQQRYSAVANIGVGGVIFCLAPFMGFVSMYTLFGILICLAGIWAFTQRPDTTPTHPQEKKLILKKKYWLYYFLTFMAGARRQIFVAFAVFLLVKKFQYNVQEITLLFLLNNGVKFYISPRIGKAIIKYGERKLLSLEYISLALIFTAYAFVDSAILAGVLYILDHVFFNFSMAIKTYFQKIAEPSDIAPSAAVGFTINHIAAVALPVLGGLAWMVDYKIPFLGGAVFSLISLGLVQLIRLPAPEST